MLDRALPRLGPVLVRADASAIALSTASVAHARAVSVLHALDDPVTLFAEGARVIRPGGRNVACSAQHPTPGDRVGQVISDLPRRVDTLLGHPRPRGPRWNRPWSGRRGRVRRRARARRPRLAVVPGRRARCH